jgi:hypothetical protein
MPAPTRRACDAVHRWAALTAPATPGTLSGRPRRGRAGRARGTRPGAPAAVGIGADRSTATTTTPSDTDAPHTSGQRNEAEARARPLREDTEQNRSRIVARPHHRWVALTVDPNRTERANSARKKKPYVVRAIWASPAKRLVPIPRVQHMRCNWPFCARVPIQNCRRTPLVWRRDAWAARPRHSGVSVRTLPRTWPQRRAMSHTTMQSMRQVRPPRRHAPRMP